MGERVALGCVGSAVELRELTGADERVVSDTTTADAIALVDRLLAGGGPRAAALPASDRDRVLVAVHRRTFGDRVEATVTCRACTGRFDLDFSLGDLEAALGLGAAGDLPADGLRLPGGARVRPPTGADELAVAGLEPGARAAALLERCVVDDAGEVDRAAFEALLETAAPVVDLDLDARCPDCGADQPVHFDIQSFLLGSLLAERPRLIADVHRLATAYRWSAEAILALPRSERRALVALAEGGA